jgi:hypothetical protein
MPIGIFGGAATSLSIPMLAAAATAPVAFKNVLREVKLIVFSLKESNSTP